MKTTHFAILLFASILTTSVQAQKADTLRTQNLNPVVITGTGTYHRVNNSPVAVQVITAQQLHDTHTTTLQDALSQLTTNVTTHTSGMGTFVNFNGISDDYIVILENGKRISGDDRWSRLSIDRVKRIEIFSGAASALYGSDAIAGVINIITDDSREGISASASTKVMDNGRMDYDVNVDATVGKLSSHTSYSYHTSDSWQVNHYQEFDEDGTSVLKLTGRPMQTAFTSHNLAECLEWQFNQKWSMYLRGSYYDNETARPQSAQYFTQKKQTDGSYTYTPKAAYTYDLHHKSYTYGAGARWSPNRRTYLYLDVYSDNYQSDYDYWQTADAEAYAETRKRTHYVNETLRGIFRLASWNKLSAGTELVQESLDSQSDNIDGEHTQTYNLFAQDELQILPGLEGVVGLRYTYNNNFGSALTPNVGLFYHIGGFRVRMSYAAGYRQPSLSQLYATDQAKTASRYTIYNADLQPEKNHFFTANLEYSNAWMSVGVTGFINRIRDMINYRTMSDAEIAANPALTAIQAEGWKTLRQRDNIDRSTLKGFSAQVKLVLPYGFGVGGGYTFTDADAETQLFNAKTQTYSTDKSPVDKSVRHVGNVQASWNHVWKNYHLNISVNGHIQSKRYSSTYGYAAGYGMWNLHTTHTIRLRNCIIEPGFGLDNVFNKRDTSYWNSNYFTINPGRSPYVSFRIVY